MSICTRSLGRLRRRPMIVPLSSFGRSLRGRPMSRCRAVTSPMRAPLSTLGLRPSASQLRFGRWRRGEPEAGRIAPVNWVIRDFLSPGWKNTTGKFPPFSDFSPVGCSDACANCVWGSQRPVGLSPLCSPDDETGALCTPWCRDGRLSLDLCQRRRNTVPYLVCARSSLPGPGEHGAWTLKNYAPFLIPPLRDLPHELSLANFSSPQRPLRFRALAGGRPWRHGVHRVESRQRPPSRLVWLFALLAPTVLRPFAEGFHRWHGQTTNLPRVARPARASTVLRYHRATGWRHGNRLFVHTSRARYLLFNQTADGRFG